MAKKDPYDPSRTPLGQRVQSSYRNLQQQTRFIEQREAAVRKRSPQAAEALAADKYDLLKGAMNAHDRAIADQIRQEKADKSGFAQHLGVLPKGQSAVKPTQRSAADGISDGFDRRQVGEPGEKFTG